MTPERDSTEPFFAGAEKEIRAGAPEPADYRDVIVDDSDKPYGAILLMEPLDQV